MPNANRASRDFTYREPVLRELLGDPVLHLMMERDGVSMKELTELIADVRRHLIARHEQRELCAV